MAAVTGGTVFNEALMGSPTRQRIDFDPSAGASAGPTAAPGQREDVPSVNLVTREFLVGHSMAEMDQRAFATFCVLLGNALTKDFEAFIQHGLARIPAFPLPLRRCHTGATSATSCCWQCFCSDSKVPTEVPVFRRDPALESFNFHWFLKGFVVTSRSLQNITFSKGFREIPHLSWHLLINFTVPGLICGKLDPGIDPLSSQRMCQNHLNSLCFRNSGLPTMVRKCIRIWVSPLAGID